MHSQSIRATPTRGMSRTAVERCTTMCSTEKYLQFAAYCNPDLPLAVAFDNAAGTADRWGRTPWHLPSGAPRTTPFRSCSRTA